MSLTKLSSNEIEELSMIELAHKFLLETNKAADFREMFDRIAELKGIDGEKRDEYIAQFYTDLNIDGSFLTIGSNLWGLKRWYPVEQIEEDVTNAPKKKKKKKTTAKKEKSLDDDTEDLDEEELDFDDADLDDDLDDFADFEEEEIDDVDDDDTDDFDQDDNESDDDEDDDDENL